MPTPLGAHNARLAAVRELLSKKGRREQGRFSFEGPTLLGDALDAGVPIEAAYATDAAFAATARLAELEARGAAVFIVDERSMARISDVETPSGVLAVAPTRYAALDEVLDEPGIVLALADLADPGNAGALLRSAEAFGVTRVVLGAGGADPYLPKLVRSAMGAIFRMRLAVATPHDLQARQGWTVVGLDAQGEPIGRIRWPQRALLLVGSERHGLGPWEALCGQKAAIPMHGRAESLNAAAAGSIALYEATKRQDS